MQEKMLFEKLNFLVGNQEVLKNITSVPALPVFSDNVIDFLNELSRKLLHYPGVKQMQDVFSYAFWIRKASVEKEKAAHGNWESRLGRGVSFHIAPSNVPVNFAVSMTSALLAGNACVIRVSNKRFEQVDIICGEMEKLLSGKCSALRPYICVLRYEHDLEVTQYLSDLCDIRVIWGGNQTINLIRQAVLPPRTIEMAFADRYSIAVIHAEEYLKLDENRVAQDFYTDTYYSDQNACSSPRLVVWTGKQKEAARQRFWKALGKLAHKEYTLRPIQAVDKLYSFCMLAAQKNTGHQVHGEVSDNYLYRIELDRLDSDVMDYKEAGGYFFEYQAEELEDIIPVLGKSCQTVAVLGVEKETIVEMIRQYGVRGGDRVVDIGKTMELSFYWDGYDMIKTMSRVIKV